MAKLTLVVILTTLAAIFLVKNGDAESVADLAKKEMEHIVKQKTSEAIIKLEKQFKATFSAYTSASDEEKKRMAKEKLEGLVDVVKGAFKENLEKAVKGFKYDGKEMYEDIANTYGLLTKLNVKRLSERETRRALESYKTRIKRSLTWGSCADDCQHKCLPTCNLLCCLAPPFNVSKKTVQRLEIAMAKKKYDASKKSKISKAEMEKGSICEKKCQTTCLPSCKFRCCIRTKKKSGYQTLMKVDKTISVQA